MKMHAMDFLFDAMVSDGFDFETQDPEEVSKAIDKVGGVKALCDMNYQYELELLAKYGAKRTTKNWLLAVGLKLRFESHDLDHPLHDYAWAVGRLVFDAGQKWKRKHNKKFTEDEWAKLSKGEFTAQGMKALADALEANTPDPAPFFMTRTFTAMCLCQALARDWDKLKASAGV